MAATVFGCHVFYGEYFRSGQLVDPIVRTLVHQFDQALRNFADIDRLKPHAFRNGGFKRLNQPQHEPMELRGAQDAPSRQT